MVVVDLRKMHLRKVTSITFWFPKLGFDIFSSDFAVLTEILNDYV
jgi:hypothetical protein